jgi:predicted hydrolase (HD superfamily)
MVGLGAGLDGELAANNPARRGEVAKEVLLAEGAAEEIGEAVRSAARDTTDVMPRAAAALVVASALVDGVHAMRGDGDGLEQVDAGLVAHKLRRAAARGEEEAVRVGAAAERAGVELPRAAELVLAGMKRIREDLRL